MPDPKVQAYLAQHYLSGPKADAILARQKQQQEAASEERRKTKKRKKRIQPFEDGSAGSSSQHHQGLKLRDEADDWKVIDEDDPEYEAQVVAESKRVGFKKGGWAILDADGNPTSASRENAEVEAEGEEEGPQLVGRDGINLDATAAELAQAQREEEDARQHREAQRGGKGGPSQPMSGLRTKEQVRADRLAREEAQRQEEQDRLAAGAAGGEDTDAQREAQLAQTTVYRDERGRRIDVEAEDEIIRKEEERKRRREREKKDWNKGERQKEEEEKRKRELEMVKKEGVARHATDERMNAELKAIERADDPALAFLTKKRPKGPQLPKYKGPPPPTNRFGIQPGYRWDGVNRGNGFEKKLFEARGARLRREQDERAYGTSDM